MSDENHQTVANANRKRSKCVMYCAVPMCGNKSNKNPEFVYHAFPQPSKSSIIETNYFGNEERLDRFTAWKKVLKMNFATAAMYVCSSHFKKTDYILPDAPSCRMRLKKDAVPSCNLPLTDPLREQKAELSERRLKRRLQREAVADAKKSKPSTSADFSAATAVEAGEQGCEAAAEDGGRGEYRHICRHSVEDILKHFPNGPKIQASEEYVPPND